MTNSNWRKRLAVWRNRFYLYPPPDAMPHTPYFWLATGLVALLALLFAGYFGFYLTGRHAAYITSAEDLGIMDQAIWSTLHGQLFHQTICNTINDTNCSSIQGISRFAIHFEPILFLVSLFYLVCANPKTLLVIQSLVVASGAFPAFWLARLRLRNELAAVFIALLYLLYPAQQQATVFDFHAVTFTASLLLFTLYFMYTRRAILLFVFAILSMACKEEIPLVILMFGLWTMLFQQRLRSGLALVILSIGWIGLGLLVIHIFSPTGQPLLASRYSALGHNPLAIARNLLLHPFGNFRLYVLDPNHMLYLRILLSPLGYLPLVAPWALVLAAPSLAVNLLSSDPNMRSGFFQYNAEIVPVLIFATIEGIVVILWIVRWLVKRFQSVRAQKETTPGETSSSGIVALARASSPTRWVYFILLFALLSYATYNDVRANMVRGALPFSAVTVDPFQGARQFIPKYQWPSPDAHTKLAKQFITMIPPAASVSAQSHLVPHVSHRFNIFLFPFADDRADYIFLDVSGNTYPLLSFDYIREVKQILLNGHYGVVAAQDGYLLLKHGLPSVGLSSYSPFQISSDTYYQLPNLPDQFCSFVHVAPRQVQNPLQITFSTPGNSSMNAVGLSVVAPRVFSLTTGSMQITTYWKVDKPTQVPVKMLVTVTDKLGKDHYVTIDFPTLAWCPTNTWQPGTIYSTVSNLFLLRGIPKGLAHVSISVLPLTDPYSKIPDVMDTQNWFPLQIGRAPSSVITSHGNKALQVATMEIVP